MTTTYSPVGPDSPSEPEAPTGHDHRGAGGSFVAWTAHQAWRTLTHPVYVFTALGLALGWVLLSVVGSGNSFPVLTNMSWEMHLPMLILVGGAFFAAHFVAVGPYRFDSISWELTHPLPRWQQICGQFVAALAPALLAGVLAMASLVLAGTREAAAASPLVGEVVSISATVLLGAALGLASAHIGKSLGVGFIAFSLLTITVVAALFAIDRPWRWLLLVVLEDPLDVTAAPHAAIARPEMWHVGWLLSLTVLIAVIIMMTAGMPTRSGATIAVLASATALTCGFQQFNAPVLNETPRWQQASLHPVSQQVCQHIDPTTYCAFPDFTSRIPAWDALVKAQLDTVPPPAANGPFYVRQRLALPQLPDGSPYEIPPEWQREDLKARTPDPVPVSTRWAGPGMSSFDQKQVLAFSLGFAYRLVTGSIAAPPPGGFGIVDLCGGPGIVTLWLATGTHAQGESAWRAVQAAGHSNSFSVADSDMSLTSGHREAFVLNELLARDHDRISSVMVKNWSLLTHENTTIERAAEILGVPAGDEVEIPEGSSLCA